jgi:hypothetical protein
MLTKSRTLTSTDAAGLRYCFSADGSDHDAKLKLRPRSSAVSHWDGIGRATSQTHSGDGSDAADSMRGTGVRAVPRQPAPRRLAEHPVGYKSSVRAV